MKAIKEFLRRTVEHYRESEFKNFGRNLGFYEARQKLLAGAKMYAYEPGSTTLSELYQGSGIETVHAIPVCGDSWGEFPDIYIIRPVTIRLFDVVDEPILSIEITEEDILR